MNEKEFNALFSSLSDKLFRMARSILRNTDEAVDAVQDLQLKMWEKRSALLTADNKTTYTLRTMRNLCIDTLRRKRHFEELPEGWETQLITDAQPAEDADMARYVSTLIDQLPEIQRTIVRMRDVEELDIAEIAEITGIKENAVCVNLSRARIKLRTQLLKELEN